MGQDTEERFRQLAHAMPHMVWTAAPDGRFTFVNRQWEDYWGLTVEQFNQREFTDPLLHPDDAAPARARWAQSLTTGDPHEVQCRLKRRSDGTYRWFLVRAVPLRDEQGRVREWLGTATDIDEQKRSEEALKGSEQRFHALAESAPAAIFIKDLEGRYTYANRYACEAVGRPQGIVGLLDRDLAPSPAAEVLRQQDLELLGGHRSLEREVRLGNRWFLLVKAPLPDAHGRPVGICAMGVDITERKRAEEALVDADRRKDFFLAVLAHELRNPLAPIRNSLEAMQIGGVSDAQRAPFRIIDRQLATLVRLVDDLLDVGRITSGKLELRIVEVSLTQIVESALETVRPYIEAAKHRLSVELPDEPIGLRVDRMRLAQVLANLLHNSAKYTPPGGSIRLWARRVASGLELYVEDNGIGIPPHALRQVFQMFAQVGETQVNAGGLGIGLALVEALVEMHGGSVRAHSEGHGRGSTFVVYLPAECLRAAAPPPDSVVAEPAREAGKRRILVVDDNRDSAVSMAVLLDLLGHETRQAFDGLHAIELAAQFRPEIILMDIGMPNMDGLEATRRIRQLELPQRPTIIAVTGWGQQADRQLTKSAGIDHHLVKPVTLEEIAALLNA
jgi:PAS domain S-box-containing protein